MKQRKQDAKQNVINTVYLFLICTGRYAAQMLLAGYARAPQSRNMIMQREAEISVLMQLIYFRISNTGQINAKTDAVRFSNRHRNQQPINRSCCLTRLPTFVVKDCCSNSYIRYSEKHLGDEKRLLFVIISGYRGSLRLTLFEKARQRVSRWAQSLRQCRLQVAMHRWKEKTHTKTFQLLLISY